MKKINKKTKKVFKIYVSLVVLYTLAFIATTVVYAADDPIAVVSNLSDFIFGLTRAIGMIILGWGVIQVGLSFQSHDPSQRSNGFLTLAGGIIITFAKEILGIIAG